jgi:hypothetical protein
VKLTAHDLAREVAATGFTGESLEKVFRLMGLLDALNSHPFLKSLGRTLGDGARTR